MLLLYQECDLGQDSTGLQLKNSFPCFSLCWVYKWLLFFLGKSKFDWSKVLEVTKIDFINLDQNTTKR